MGGRSGIRNSILAWSRELGEAAGLESTSSPKAAHALGRTSNGFRFQKKKGEEKASPVHVILFGQK